jgi:uncharacterized protein YndB with AHSA1/START domain
MTTTIERTSDHELVVSRRFDFPAEVVFAAWTQAERFAAWWVPKSCGLSLSACEIDARPGGRYRLVFTHPEAPSAMEVFGVYLEVTLNAGLVWTNEEQGDGGQVTAVSFEARGGTTLLRMRETYPSAAALDDAVASGSTSGFAESFDQLDALLGGAASPG